MEAPNRFRPAELTNAGALSELETRVLVWLAHRIPNRVNSDHLTALGFASLIAVGLSYWYSRYSRIGLLARVRNRQRSRYGFYLDHILDACGSIFVFAGLALSGYMSERIALGLFRPSCVCSLSSAISRL